MEVTVSIPDELGDEFAADEKNLRRQVQADLAMSYYAAGRVSVGRAAEMSGLSRAEFERLLARWRVMRNYSHEDLVHDLDRVRSSSE